MELHMVDSRKTMKQWLEILKLNPNVCKGLEGLCPHKKWWQKGAQFRYWGLSQDPCLGSDSRLKNDTTIITSSSSWLWMGKGRRAGEPWGAWMLPALEFFTLMLILWAGQKNITILYLIWVNPVTTVSVLPDENVKKKLMEVILKS